MKWVYRQSDNTFLYGGPYEPDYNPATQGLIVTTRHPDRRTERHDGNGGIRAATEQEIAAYDSEQLDERARHEVDNLKAQKATLLLLRAYCNALAAGTYTQKTIAEVRADFIAAYKAL